MSLGRLKAPAPAFRTRVWDEITAPPSLPLRINCTSLTYDGKSMREIEPEGLPAITAPHGHRRVSPLAFGDRLPNRRPAARVHACSRSAIPRGSSRERLRHRRVRAAAGHRGALGQYP